MQEAQQTEEFIIYGIQSEYAAQGQIKYEDFRSLVADNLQMQPIFDLVIRILQEEFEVQIVDKVKLDIQSIYKCFNHIIFLKEVPRFLNGRLTIHNINIIKAAVHLLHDEVLTIKDIKDACLIFHLREQELMTEGVPIEQVQNLLWQINKAISVKVLEEWVKKCQDFFQIKGYLQPFEFLYLMANTVDRWAYHNKYPKPQLNLSRDPKYNLYNVDSTGFKTIKNPDAKIQHYMNYQYNLEKATFKGRSLNDRSEHYQQKRNQKFQQFIKKNDSTLGDFRKILRDPELYVEIRQRLKNAQQIINHSKLNGKMLRIQMLEEFTGIKDLKEHPQFQKRQGNDKIQQIKLEVDEHKKMMNDTAFVTEYMQRATSAGSIGTSFKHPNRTTQRPSTAALTSQKALTTARPLTAMTHKISNIDALLDDEITQFETQMEQTQNQSKIVFYGSAHSTKRLFSVNTPWKQKQLDFISANNK